MKKIGTFLAVSMLAALNVAPAFASMPDVYVVNFRDNKSSESQTLDQQLHAAMASVPGNIEHVIIDTSTAAKWEKGAHEAIDRDIVPVFNQWVGLPGFAAIVDARSKQVLGCVNSHFQSEELAQEISRMSRRAGGKATLSKVAFNSKTTKCPPVYNKPPK